MQKMTRLASAEHKLQRTTVRRLIIGSLGLAAVGTGIAYAATHGHQVKDGIRYLNKHLYNRFTLTFAGRKGSSYAVIYHTGRTSGKTYETPVVAEPTPTGFIIPLPYGSETDWCLNLRHAGSAILKRNGTTYHISQPERVNEGFAKSLLAERAYRLLHFFGVREYLHMQSESLAAPAEVTEAAEVEPAHT